MEGEFIDVQLTREERGLIMRYGCPFDGLKASLETCDDHEFVVIPVEKAGGTSYGGLAAIHAFAQKIGLPNRVDAALNVFKKHRPYHESDHVLNFAYNALCGGTSLQHMEPY